MAIDVIKEEDGSIKIVKTGCKECQCTVEKVLADKSKIEEILNVFDTKVSTQKAKIIADFDTQMAELKLKHQSKLNEINEVLAKAIAAGCIVPE